MSGPYSEYNRGHYEWPLLYKIIYVQKTKETARYEFISYRCTHNAYENRQLLGMHADIT